MRVCVCVCVRERERERRARKLLNCRLSPIEKKTSETGMVVNISTGFIQKGENKIP